MLGIGFSFFSKLKENNSMFIGHELLWRHEHISKDESGEESSGDARYTVTKEGHPWMSSPLSSELGYLIEKIE